MSKTNAAYVAGIIDGEGWIGIVKQSGYYREQCKVDNTCKKLIDWLYHSFGGSYYQQKGKREGNKMNYVWYLRKGQVYKILKTVYPYMKVKRKQAEIIFQFEGTKERSSGRYYRLPDYVKKKREELMLQIKALNHRSAAVETKQTNT